MTTPRPRMAPGSATPTGRGAATDASVLGSGLPLSLEDLGDLSLLRVEQLVVHLRPAAQEPDLEQVGGLRELRLVHQALHDRAVALGGVDLLCLRRTQEVDE